MLNMCHLLSHNIQHPVSSLCWSKIICLQTQMIVKLWSLSSLRGCPFNKYIKIKLFDWFVDWRSLISDRLSLANFGFVLTRLFNLSCSAVTVFLTCQQYPSWNFCLSFKFNSKKDNNSNGLPSRHTPNVPTPRNSSRVANLPAQVSDPQSFP